MSKQAFAILFLIGWGLWLLAGIGIEKYQKRRPWPREQHPSYFGTCKRVDFE